MYKIISKKSFGNEEFDILYNKQAYYEIIEDEPSKNNLNASENF